MKTRASFTRRAIDYGAALAIVVGATSFVGCSDDDDPTGPGGGADPGLAISGSGSGTLPRLDFAASNSFVGGGGGYFWEDDGMVPARLGDLVELSVFPVGDVASSAGLVFGASTWIALGGVGGVEGVSISETRVTFTDVELADATTVIILNGFLDVPTGTGTTPPAAPSGVLMDGIDNGLFASWDTASDAVTYNLYYASETGVTPENYLSLANGAVITDIAPVPSRTSRTFGVGTIEPYFVVVTAMNAGGESLPSAEVTATPNDPDGPFGSLTVGGDSPLDAIFAPLSSWPGNNNQAVYLWNDPVSGAALAVNYDRVNDEIDNVYIYDVNSTWGVLNPSGGVAGAAVTGSQFVFTNVQLPGVGGETTMVTLDGTLDRGTVVDFAGSSLTFSGTDVPGVLNGSFTATGINVVDTSAVLEFVDSVSGTEVTVDIGGVDRVVAVFVETMDGARWETDFFAPPPDVTLDGNRLGFTNIECLDLIGTGATAPVTINGNLFW
jgi:hypothetical protein